MQDPTTPVSSTPTPSNGEKTLPLKTKIAYGFGGITDHFLLSIPNNMALPVYTKQFGMDTGLLGIAMALPRIIAAFADSFFGGYSDNLRTRWGRRRPLMIIGVVCGVLMMPFFWTPPTQFGNVGLFIYLAVLTSVFSIFYSAYSVSYQALGYELSDDYDERTRIQAWKGYVMAGGFFLGPWMFWFCSRDIFSSLATGAIWFSVIMGAVIIGCSVFTVKTCSENVEVQKQAKMPILQALKITFSNRPFLILQAANLFTFMGVCCGGTVGFYLLMDYVCRGDEKFFGLLTGVSGNVANIMTYVGMSLGLWLSVKAGKKTTAVVGIGGIILGILLLFPFLQPEYAWLTWVPKEYHPWFTMIPGIPMNLGLQCCGLVYSSMAADVCDEDEVKTGLRREGAYVAVSGFLNKTMMVLLMGVTGFMPHLIGYTDMSVKPTLDQLVDMKWILIAFQSVLTLIGLCFLSIYPITKTRAQENRKLLDERKKASLSF